MTKKLGNWFKCKGCNQPIGFFPDGSDSGLPPGSVAHSKPTSKLGIPNSVPCVLYNQLDAQELADLHLDAEPIEAPTSMTPFYQ